MPINGYRDYKRREYCNDVECQIQLLLNEQAAGTAQYERLRQICKTDCLRSTYEFHHWLMDKDFLIVKERQLG